MSLFAIARITDSTGRTKKLRLLDLNTKEYKDKPLKEVISMVKRDRHKYINSNLCLLALEDYKGYNKYIMSHIPEIDKQGYNIKDEFSVLKKLGEYNKFLICNTEGECEELLDVEASTYNLTNARITNDRKFIILHNVVADRAEHKDTEKEREIKAQYDKFIAKCKLLNIDNSFEYIVEKDDVILTEFTGNTTKVIVPSFVTVIGSYAFNAFNYVNRDRENNYRVVEVVLSEGLRKIHSNAFMWLEIENITIPSTVEIIHKSAFIQCNLNEDNNEGTIKKDCIKLLNQNTIIK